MVILNFSKEQFIEWTTIGYPIQFNENINQKKFFEGMNDYINFNDNEFYSEFNAVILIMLCHSQQYLRRAALSVGLMSSMVMQQFFQKLFD